MKVDEELRYTGRMERFSSIEIGQVLNLRRPGEVQGRSNGIPYRRFAGSDHPISGWMSHNVRVTGISFNRYDLHSNMIWIEVQDLEDSSLKGWIKFDPGGWDENFRLRIERITFQKHG